ncbi:MULTISPECIES: tetratricopeptide repeat protein [unclassified Actinomyces]|uniref:tetratricopeptide repeat protein n=1 Tax=unclassified Actinomyces TaxID=2609248 RepID=UPI0013A6CFAA|nr:MULTISPECIES: tetratricopeptide repeat protein [unclassified Actinomyces]MBW3067965.1 tetratricopeptide repeat protein [Actinomyces sp. 594]NDR53342.1 tetratricopeptide repeat protein [Actinomyces sp. 565]
MRQAQGNEESRAQETSGEPNREELAAFLATAPEGLKGWAAAQLADLEADLEADPEAGRAGKAADAAAAAARRTPDGEPADEPAPEDGIGHEQDGEDDGEDAADVEDLLAEDDDAAPARPVKAVRGRTSATARPRGGVSRLNLVLVALLAAAVVIIVQQAGQDDAADTALPEGHPSIAATADASAIAAMDEAEPVDTEREAELQAQAQADPADAQSRQELGVMYLKAALYQDSITWLQQILDVDPDNLDALLTIGVAEYQSNQYEQAEAHWLRAAEIDPDVAEPWYNLGFLYMARTPPDADRANQCWEKVLQLAPDSEMAANVRGHVGTMGSATATPSAG